MYVLDMREYQAHQRKIVRHFAPHLSNAALATQERSYFALAVARVLLVFLVPATAMLLVHGSFMKTPAFVLLALLCVVEIGLAMVSALGHSPVRVDVGSWPLCCHSIATWCSGQKASACAGTTGMR